MVTKIKLLEKIASLEKKQQEDKEMFLKAIKVMNEKITRLQKGEKAKEQEQDLINDWLTDPRVDEVQSFINKGVK